MSAPSPPLSHIQEQLKAGTRTCSAQVREYLATIQRQVHLGAFLSVYADEALQRAQEIDDRLAAGHAGKLAGLVFGIKDVFAYHNHPLSAASRILDSFSPPFSATVVDRLLQEDAILIGRQNCDEFGMGSSTENSAFGPSRNPADPARTPGGSSGGSAAAVAADLCAVSIGSDTGGSVRQPAAFCGVYGLKPTYGRISRHGLVAYASSFDTVGIISRHLEDMARVLAVVAGADEHDSTVSHEPVRNYSAAWEGPAPLRLAVFRQVLNAPGLQQEVRNALEAAMQKAGSLGHHVTLVDFPLLDYLLPTYYILATAEASSNLSRYDGVRYGHRTTSPDNLESLYKQSRSEGFGKEVQRRMLLGTFVLSADHHEAYYSQAQKVRRLIRDHTRALFEQHDIILLPTTPTTAFPLGSVSDPVTLYLGDIFSVQANVAGVPAISFPFGKDNAGLPIGLQAMARDFREDHLLTLARILTV